MPVVNSAVCPCVKEGVSKFTVPATAMFAKAVVFPGPDCVSTPPMR